MASALHAGPPTDLQTRLPLNNGHPIMNGMQAMHQADMAARNHPSAQQHTLHRSQSSFDMSGSFPTTTPNVAPSRGSMGPYNMSQAPMQQNGAMVPQHAFQSYGLEGYGPPVAAKPSIYTAVYSGVSVYEMEVQGIAIMRRRADSWLNATQILKVAGIEKGKRTKVLEREILTGEHEKVQGGYGKYQGTWVKYERGVEFCRQYGVDQLLRPLLEYDMGQDGTSSAGQGMDTPTKEQAMAAQRKRLYNSSMEKGPVAQSSNGTFFKNISSTASNAVAAISKARFDSPVPRPGSGPRRPGLASRPSQHMGSQDSSYHGASQQSMQSFHTEGSFNENGTMDSTYGTQSAQFYGNFQPRGNQVDFQEPPRKRIKPDSQDSSFVPMPDPDVSMRDGTPTEPNESFVYQQHGHFLPPEEDGVVPLEPLPHPTGKTAEEKHQLLTSLFLDPSQTDFSNHPAFQKLSTDDLDLPLDSTAHTALHWAATLARIPLLRSLISRGASIFRVNNGGETALMRACVVTNNLDQGSFSDLLEMLGPTIEMRDGRGRTVLHHIAVSSAVKGRNAASKYYLESLLEFVVRQGSGASGQANSINGTNSQAAPPTMKAIGLGRFMSEIVNAQDKSGDTALNLAARIGNRNIIQQLLEVGADTNIPNRGGLRPVDFGVTGQNEGENGNVQAENQETTMQDGEMTVSSAVGETSRDIISSISALLSSSEQEFAAEIRVKQELIDSTHSQLRECSAALAEERRRLESRQHAISERKELRRKLLNLRRAAEEQRLHLSQQVPTNENDIPHLSVTDSVTETVLESLPSEKSVSSLTDLSPNQFSGISSLPSTALLQLRLNAYYAANASLKQYSTQLKSRSEELEEKYRRVIAMCTGTPEDKIDTLLAGLVQAVESEGGEMADVGRVREFLRKVEGVD